MFGLVVVLVVLIAFELAAANMAADTSDGRDWRGRSLGGTR